MYVGDDGKIHFTDSAGADSALPFSKEQYYTNVSTSLTNTQVYVTQTFYLLDDSISQVMVESFSTGDNGLFIGSSAGTIKNWGASKNTWYDIPDGATYVKVQQCFQKSGSSGSWSIGKVSFQ